MEIIRQMEAKGLKVFSTRDKDVNDQWVALEEMDPFTFFANFNRAITEDNRRGILSELKTIWKLESDLPEDFCSIPTANNQSTWFFAYVKNRGKDDINNLWRLAHETLEKTPQNFNRELLEACLKIKTIALPKMTIGLYWLNPRSYMSVDWKNRDFIAGKGIILRERSVDGYFEWLEEVTKNIGNNFPELSYQAELSSKQKTDGSEEVSSKTIENRYWVIAAGTGGNQWEDFKEHEIIAIDLPGLEDVRTFQNKSEFSQRLAILYPGEGSKNNDSLACWQFAHKMKVGDTVFAKL